MRRQVSLDEISDGKLYDLNDCVKADCHDCQGCSSCCRGMGSSILLDPLDVHRLRMHLGKSFDELLEEALELRMVDGTILPNLRMAGSREACVFLSGEGRCGIHAARPGICRLFPLGRYYEDRSFRYFLQVKECKRQNRSKVKVRRWIDMPDFNRYEQFIADWHYFLKDLQIPLAKKGEKISKSKSNSALSPTELIAAHSADAIRYWAANAKLGTDTFFAPEDLSIIKNGPSERRRL